MQPACYKCPALWIVGLIAAAVILGCTFVSRPDTQITDTSSTAEQTATVTQTASPPPTSSPEGDRQRRGLIDRLRR